MTSLHCSTSKYGDLTVVTASGDVDFATSEALWDALRAPLVPLVPLSALGLECTGITFFDSTGLQVLMRTRQLAFEQRASFSLIGENRYLEQVLKLTGLTDVIPHFVDIKAAQAGLDRGASRTGIGTRLPVRRPTGWIADGTQPEHSVRPDRSRVSGHVSNVLSMNPELLSRLQPFREEALRRGLPSADVERWIATARPSGTLVTSGDGPVVGRFGGPLMLPTDAPAPWFPLLATLDCAALPEEVTGLPLPPDGRLLLFGFPEMAYYGASVGEVVYVPADTPVEERKANYPCVYGEEGSGSVDEENLSIYEQFPQAELRLSADIGLPYHFLDSSAEPPYEDAPLPGHPHAWELATAWQDTSGGITVDGPLHIGGYAFHECTEADPVASAAEEAVRLLQRRAANNAGDDAGLISPEDWTLLAQWDIGLTGREGSTLHWVIPRQDLSERRFDRAYVSFFWNP